ncbi:RICIN domain-containing protein [Streptomyces sp. NPDC127051]|uniref:RICIN domain-containing protein n=1 Tax=Streptomyces sp. NPDC127051 TaxID=3347119 RepID=UPI003667CB7C
MTGKLVTREERLKRLQEQLQGLAEPSGRTAQSSKGSRLLYGVARRAAGLELTDLEARLVPALRAVLADDEELREFGQVYSEEAAGRSHLFPDCLSARPVSEGYSEADLLRDLPSLAGEIAAQRNVRVVDLDAVDGKGGPGFRTDEEFEGAAHGWGATVMTASGQEPEAANAPAVYARMSLTKFSCLRESNEWSGSDEFYWAVCAAADEGTKKAVATRTFGDVDKGETHKFDSGTIAFEGMVKNALIVHIECWEKDQGSQATVQRMLAEMTTELRTTAQKLALLPLGDWQASEHYSAMAGMLAELAYALIQASTDDWVDGHVFTYDRAALQRLSGTEFKVSRFEDTSKQEGSNDLYARIDVFAGPDFALTVDHTGAVSAARYSGLVDQSFTVHQQADGSTGIRHKYHPLVLGLKADGTVTCRPYDGLKDQSLRTVSQADGSTGIRSKYYNIVLTRNGTDFSGVPYNGSTGQSFTLRSQADGSTGIRSKYQ